MIRHVRAAAVWMDKDLVFGGVTEDFRMVLPPEQGVTDDTGLLHLGTLYFLVRSGPLAMPESEDVIETCEQWWTLLTSITGLSLDREGPCIQV